MLLTRRAVLKRLSKIIGAIATTSVAPSLLAGCSSQEIEQDRVNEINQTIRPVDINQIRLSIAYDNVPYDRALTADWGFSCLVEGLDKTILFDTGKDAKTLLNNMSKLNLDPRSIDSIFISHDHEDHVTGTAAIVEHHPQTSVSLVTSFRSGFKNKLRKMGATVAEVGQPAVVSKHCFSTGELKDFVRNEHALVILTDAGLIVVTGCAHPGVADIVSRAKRITNREVLLVMGGFHLLRESYSHTEKVARSLNDMGVTFVAPSHCSGSDASRSFAKVFGHRYLESGAGRVITSNDFS